MLSPVAKKRPGKENPEDCYQGTAPNADWGLSLIEGYGLRWDILYSYESKMNSFHARSLYRFLWSYGSTCARQP